jgi:hypothetical protein
MYCETFISYLARTCSHTTGFLTSHGDIDVDEEGYTTMMFEEGKTFPPDDALDSSEGVSEGGIRDMESKRARLGH